MKTLSYGYIPMYQITRMKKSFIFSGNTTFYMKCGNDLLFKYRIQRESGHYYSIFHSPMNGGEINIGDVLTDKNKIRMENNVESSIIIVVHQLLVQLVRTYDTKPVTIAIYYDGRCIKCSSFISNERFRAIGYCQACYEGKFGVLKR